ASELAFLKEPSDVIAVRDRPLMLDCQVEGEGPISITWWRNGIPVETGVRAALLSNGTLLIRNVSKRRDSNETDAGEYSCAAQNHYGMLISRKARILLACTRCCLPACCRSLAFSRQTAVCFAAWPQTSPTRATATRPSCQSPPQAPAIYREPVILSGPQNLTINVHQTAILECIATGNPRPIVSWNGRSIGVEGIQVLGTGNLMISDASLQHSGVYVCSANRPGSRSRRTALGRLVVQAPPEFLQWPQSASRPAGGSAIFSCTASGVPEPHLIWLKNGKLLTPSGNVKLTNGNTTLAITHISSEDEAIYQCIAENSAGTNQASARLAISAGRELPEAPAGLRAAALSASSLQLTWDPPAADAGQDVIGYVLHIRRLGDADGAELQEAVSKSTFSQRLDNLEAATTYCVFLKAYSALGASQQSSTVMATTKGGVPTAPSFFTKVLNQTAMQVDWELPSRPGTLEGFRLEYRGVSNPGVQGWETFPAHVNTHTISGL
ncbi:unnamed protein product, partial [Tetraodon nigroviridis]